MFRPGAERLRMWQVEEEFDLGEEFAGAGVSTSEEGAWVNAGPAGSSSSSSRIDAINGRTKAGRSSRWSRWMPTPPLKATLGMNSAVGSVVGGEEYSEQQVEFEYDEGVPLAPSPKRYGHAFSKGYGSAG